MSCNTESGLQADTSAASVASEKFSTLAVHGWHTAQRLSHNATAIMRIKLISIHVDDQQRALEFYTGILGFVKKHDVPAGGARWLTVVAPQGPDDLELVLEPNTHPAAAAYQAALMKDGIPATAFESADILTECQQLKERGVVFTLEPTDAGPVRLAIFADTCGNLLQIYEPIQPRNAG
jgi:catechol 2,3-dioxygenase-like lactoylglutathione lyase family enzyme